MLQGRVARVHATGGMAQRAPSATSSTGSTGSKGGVCSTGGTGGACRGARFTLSLAWAERDAASAAGVDLRLGHPQQPVRVPCGDLQQQGRQPSLPPDTQQPAQCDTQQQGRQPGAQQQTALGLATKEDVAWAASLVRAAILQFAVWIRQLVDRWMCGSMEGACTTAYLPSISMAVCGCGTSSIYGTVYCCSNEHLTPAIISITCRRHHMRPDHACFKCHAPAAVLACLLTIANGQC